jgi:hypothetical protein
MFDMLSARRRSAAAVEAFIQQLVEDSVRRFAGVRPDNA